MARYAANTSVSTEKSRAEIESTLQRYGADAFQYGWANDPPQAIIQFRAHERHIRFVLTLPARDDEEFTMTPTGKERSEDAAYKAWEQAGRQRWRALALAIKAKLEAVESGIAEFEEEFLAYVVDPESRQTVGQLIRPQLEHGYSGENPQPLRLEMVEN